MKTIEFIKEHGLQALTDQLGIKVKTFEDHRGLRPDLIVLDYSQIDSPKTHPVVMECRGLTLQADTLKVVARGYDRFFNLGEALNVTPEIDWKNAELYEKVDGSFIKIYYYNGFWEIATRGTAYANNDCMGHGVTFRELVYKALKVNDDIEFQNLMHDSVMLIDNTYLFELTSFENRVVKHYQGYNLHFLGSRETESGIMYTEDEIEWIKDQVCPIGKLIQYPKKYSFKNEEECLRTVRELKDLDEGFVIYEKCIPIAKIKSPVYVATHLIRGDGLNHKRISQLVLSGEVDEYVSYFPEDIFVIQPYIDANKKLVYHIESVYDSIKHIDCQKDFAVKAEHLPFKAALFQARSKNIDPVDAFNKQRDCYKIEILKEYL